MGYHVHDDAAAEGFMHTGRGTFHYEDVGKVLFPQAFIKHAFHGFDLDRVQDAQLLSAQTC